MNKLGISVESALLNYEKEAATQLSEYHIGLTLSKITSQIRSASATGFSVTYRINNPKNDIRTFVAKVVEVILKGGFDVSVDMEENSGTAELGIYWNKPSGKIVE